MPPKGKIKKRNPPMSNAKAEHKMQPTGRKRKSTMLNTEAERILANIRKGYPRRLINVMMIGSPGVGKSCLTNSLLMAINEKGYQSVANSGSFGAGGGAGAITQYIKRYDLRSHLEVPETAKDKDNYYKSAICLWDTPGLQNAQDDTMKFMLGLLMQGHIENKNDIRELLRFSEEEMEELYAEYTSLAHEREIHLILFVHAWKEPPPLNLINAVIDAKKMTEREIRLCLVVTKCDLAKTEDDKINMERSTRALSDQLGLTSCDDRIFNVTLYTSSAGRNEEIDKMMCKIWKCIQNESFYEKEYAPDVQFELREKAEKVARLERNAKRLKREQEKEKERNELHEHQLKEKDEKHEKQLEEEREQYQSKIKKLEGSIQQHLQEGRRSYQQQQEHFHNQLREERDRASRTIADLATRPPIIIERSSGGGCSIS